MASIGIARLRPGCADLTCASSQACYSYTHAEPARPLICCSFWKTSGEVKVRFNIDQGVWTFVRGSYIPDACEYWYRHVKPAW